VRVPANCDLWAFQSAGDGLDHRKQAKARHMKVLGIETSCDETAAAIVRRDPDGEGAILANIVRSQFEEHAPYGGVVPELAARAHVEHLDRLIGEALRVADIGLDEIDAIAATAGPGLIGGVLVGLMTGKALAAALGRPLVAVNHLEAHALTARLTDGVAFPYLMLLVSGGHSQFVLVRGVGDYERWGTTIDDALGEAFDKVAKLLDLGTPGGPAVERMAARGDAQRFRFPRPLLRELRLDFSFSGLKTAVRLAAEAIAPLTAADAADICASFQAAATEIVAVRAGQALARWRTELPELPPQLVVAGGVAANRSIGAALRDVAAVAGARLVIPPAALCTDNGAMVAWAGAERLALGLSDGLEVAARPRWPLDAPGMNRHAA
jgi:N6-L-threonylcarbamoyladenine synthase